MLDRRVVVALSLLAAYAAVMPACYLLAVWLTK